MSQLIISSVPDKLSEGWRVNSFLVLESFFSLGVMLVGVAYWLIRPWWLALLLYQLVPTLVALVAMFTFWEETPLEQVTRFPPEESEEAFRRIAAINGVTSDISKEEIVAVREDYFNSLLGGEGDSLGVRDIFKYESLRRPAA